ncbi:MAG: DUF92 domain-containing protein [Gemmatimonadales bacterium]
MAFPSALAISLLVALGGFAARALTRAGTVAATLVGTAILWRTGTAGLAALGTFFVGASLISRLAPDPAARALEAKGNTRDAIQVLANGGAAALAALLAPGATALWCVTASLAAAAADTWATSAGGWSRIAPRHVLTGRTVPPGTSGGITSLGSAGAAAGALSVAGMAGLVARDLRLVVWATTIGVAGMLLDSVIGAALQGRFHCDRCDADTERAMHRCGSATRVVGGFRWITNDGVNALATLAAALLGYLAS